MNAIRFRLLQLLRASERYTKTDMVYLARSGSLLTATDLALAFVSLGVAVLFAALVPKETYGIYRYVISVVSLAAALSLSGMNNAVIRAVAIGHEGAFRRSLLPQAAFAVLQLAALGCVAAYYFMRGNEAYGLAFSAVALLAPFAGVFNTYAAFLIGKKEFVTVSWWRLQAGLLQAAALVAVLFASPTVIALVVAYYLSSLVATAFFTWRTLRRFRPNAENIPEDLALGKHLSVVNAAGLVASQLDALLVYHLLGPAALAVYSFAVLIPDRIRSIAAFLPSAALPKLATRTNEERRATLPRRMLVMALALSAIAAAYALIAPYVFSFLFPRYLDAIPYTQFASLFVFATLASYLSTLLTAEAAHRALYIAGLVPPLLKIALSVAGILLFGIWGAIGARILAGVIEGGLSAILLRRVGSGTA